MALFVYFYLFLALDWGFKNWNGEGDSSRLERASPKFCNVAENFDCTLFFFLIVIPNTVRCIVTGSPLPAQKPPHFSLRRASPCPSPHRRVIALLLCKLCNPNFFNLRLNTCFFVLFYLNGQASWPPFLSPNLMYEGFWSPWEWVEVWKQPGLTCTLT